MYTAVDMWSTSKFAAAPSRAHSPTCLLQAALTQLDGQKVGRQGFASEAEAAQAAARVAAAQLQVAALSSKVSPALMLDCGSIVSIIICKGRRQACHQVPVLPR
jgi:hypothetical protein